MKNMKRLLWLLFCIFSCKTIVILHHLLYIWDICIYLYTYKKKVKIPFFVCIVCCMCKNEMGFSGFWTKKIENKLQWEKVKEMCVLGWRWRWTWTEKEDDSSINRKHSLARLWFGHIFSSPISHFMGTRTHDSFLFFNFFYKIKK